MITTREGVPYWHPEHKEAHVPKYKINPIPGMPDWFTPGIVCRVRDFENHTWEEQRTLCGFIPYDKSGSFVDSEGNVWRYAEPVEQWEPKEGEWVSAFDQADNSFRITKFKHASKVSIFMTDDGVYQHVARLQYPDGRVIDCACDVETLKRRTDWI